ncbi:MAG: hypothetical protein RugAbin2_02411 [Rugosibacter sp.]|nr:hypothetical protein [Rugosibacter sp.]
MGGSKSSSSSSNQTINTDKRLVVDGGGVGVSSDSSTVNVTQTDLGAIGRAFDFATTSGANVVTTLDKVLGIADTVLKGSLASVQSTNSVVSQAYETAKNTTSGAIDQKTMIVMAIAGAVVFVARGK